MFASPVMKYSERLKSFIIPKLKFAASGAIATTVDYVIYLTLVRELTPVVSNIISYSLAVLVNFTLQKNFIFTPKRKSTHAFMMSILFSLVGLLLSTFLIYLLNEMVFFDSNQYIIKLIVTGIVFFYNFYTKRFAFENR